MNAERLLEHFDKISEAPDAIPRLRRFILDLAVRGKLVEQDPADEPAEGLWKRIQSGKSRSSKKADIADFWSHIEPSEIPFELPDNWLWVRLGDVFEYDAGDKFEPGQLSQDSWLLELEDIEKDSGRILQRLTVAERSPSSTKSGFQVGDVLYGKLRPYLNKVVVPDKPGFCTTEIVALRCHGESEPRFTSLALRRSDFADYVTRLGQGTKMPRLRREDAVKALFPLAPLAEQRRIVAKVDELMTLCDKLESARNKREKRRDRLVTAALCGLNYGDEGEGTEERQPFRESARFYLSYLPKMTARPEHVQQLRQTILNLAVRGKLVPQDPGDEPASELLVRIQRAKRIKPEISEITRFREPFGVPPGWEAVRFEDVLFDLQTGPFGSALHQHDYEKGGTPVVNPASIRDGKIVPIDDMAVDNHTLERLSSFKLQVGDVVMGRRGEMGRCAVVTEKEAGWLCGTGSLLLRFTKEISPWFIVKLMSAPSVREYLGGSAVGATMQNLNQSILRGMTIGLPPLVEQNRIVERVDELAGLCHILDAGLVAGVTAQKSLFGATVVKALVR